MRKTTRGDPISANPHRAYQPWGNRKRAAPDAAGAPKSHRLRAWVRRGRLDQELAAGGDPYEERLRTRAATLTQDRTRETVASRLESAVAEAQLPPRRDLSAAIPLRREAVRDARPLILSLALALREPGPVSPQGVARARLLVNDGRSSLYWNESPSGLLVGLRSAIAALHLGQRLGDNGDD